MVGVGRYPYFREGGPDSNPLAPLGQLTSSSNSAQIMAQWFRDEYRYPPAPLGSLVLLPDPSYEEFAVAAKAWFARGNSDEENRLVFLFCGHGYGYGAISSLLMADFDFRDGDAWDSALDLGKFVAGMETCAAAEQIYFIDACRRPHGDLLAPGAPIGRTPVHAKQAPRQNFSKPWNAPQIFSTGEDQVARGRTDGASVFTDAFLKAVRGMAARDDNGDWRVNNYSLLEAMSHVSVRATQQHFPQPQQPQGAQASAFDFHFLAHDPISPIYIDRDAGRACGPGVLHFEVGGAPMTRPCRHEEFELELELPYGGYQFALKDGANPIASAQQRSAPTYKKARLV